MHNRDGFTYMPDIIMISYISHPLFTHTQREIKKIVERVKGIFWERVVLFHIEHTCVYTLLFFLFLVSCLSLISSYHRKMDKGLLHTPTQWNWIIFDAFVEKQDKGRQARSPQCSLVLGAREMGKDAFNEHVLFK